MELLGDQDAIAGFRVERESWNAKRNRWQSLSSWDVLVPTATTFEDSSVNGEVHYRVGTIQKSDGSLFWSGWSDNITVAGSGGGGAAEKVEESRTNDRHEKGPRRGLLCF